MQKKFTPEVLAMFKKMFNDIGKLTPDEIRKKMQEQDDFMRFRVMTGFSEQIALEVKASLKCSLKRATDYYARQGVLPDEFHQLLLRKYEAWDIHPQLHGIGYNLN